MTYLVNIVDELTSIIQDLKLDQFLGETVLKQYYVDKRNDVSVYRLPETGKTKGPFFLYINFILSIITYDLSGLKSDAGSQHPFNLRQKLIA